MIPLADFRALVADRPESVLVRHGDEAITVAQLDARSDALAAALRVAPGGRVALLMQNVPEYVVALLATWKAGAIAVPVNPMLTPPEVAAQLGDARPAAAVAADELAERLPPGVRVLRVSELPSPGAPAPDVPAPRAADVAVLTYTSGTTGPPKGAMNTHGNIAFSARVYRDWCALDEDDGILGVAPLFHVTGLVAHVALALLTGGELLLAGRFDALRTARLVEAHRPSFTVAAITVFIALMNEPAVRGHDLSSLTKIYSGGAPIAPATVEAWERLTGTYIHNVYGLTETTSPALAVPLGERAPVDPASGALSVGRPVFDTTVEVAGDEEVGELVISGPQVVPGYWERPEESGRALPGGALRTGDVGKRDADGWFYVVDRSKDMIVASGFKVWPRVVEDVLYQHPSVREAAVVGVPDAYRGETVKAFVSLRDGERLDAGALVAFCRERLAAYKVPRQIEAVDEIPKTASGKILRRSLRD